MDIVKRVVFFVIMILLSHKCATQIVAEKTSSESKLPCTMIKADDVREIFGNARRMKAFTCMLELGSRDHPDAPLEDVMKKFVSCLSDAGISPWYDVVI